MSAEGFPVPVEVPHGAQALCAALLLRELVRTDPESPAQLGLRRAVYILASNARMSPNQVVAATAEAVLDAALDLPIGPPWDQPDYDPDDEPS